VRVFWLKRKELIDELRRVAEEVGRNDRKVVKIVLFGSLAEGRAVPGSDADVLVLLKEDERRFMDRIPEYLDKFSIDFPVDVFPYTLNEVNPLVEEALKKGLVLFERSVQ
jgi:predicted nucleotidyltransferase